MKFDIRSVNLDFIKEKFPLEKAFFFMPELLLKINASWPYLKTSPVLIFCLNILNSCSLLFMGALIFKAAAQVFAIDPLEALDPIGPGMSFIITWIKYLYFWYYKLEYRDVLDYCRVLFLAGKLELTLTRISIENMFI